MEVGGSLLFPSLLPKVLSIILVYFGSRGCGMCAITTYGDTVGHQGARLTSGRVGSFQACNGRQNRTKGRYMELYAAVHAISADFGLEFNYREDRMRKIGKSRGGRQSRQCALSRTCVANRRHDAESEQ